MIVIYTHRLFTLRAAIESSKESNSITETINFFRGQDIEIKFENLMVSWQLHFNSPEQETVFKLKYSEYL